jgi:hypothetical protein
MSEIRYSSRPETFSNFEAFVLSASTFPEWFGRDRFFECLSIAVFCSCLFANYELDRKRREVQIQSSLTVAPMCPSDARHLRSMERRIELFLSYGKEDKLNGQRRVSVLSFTFMGVDDLSMMVLPRLRATRVYSTTRHSNIQTPMKPQSASTK